MSLGQHAVIVQPNRFAGSSHELAERLAPVLRIPSDRVEEMLSRGPVTVDADLDEMAARRLLRRLDGLGIPADVRDASGRKLEASPAEPSLPKPAGLESHTTDTPREAGGVSSMQTSIGAEESDPWGAILPGLSNESASPGMPTPAEAPGEIATDATPIDPRSAALIAEFEASASQSGSRDIEQLAQTSGPAPPSAPRPPRQPPSPGPRQPASPGPRQPASPGPRQPASPGPRQPARPGPRDDRADRQPARADRAFDSSLMTAALTTDDSRRPPYAPTGFDANPPHFPGLAAALSVVAPGAGQIYNGDDDDAFDYGTRFFLIAPWIKSVKHAHRRGEKVSEYWLPRPEDGALFRAIRYAVTWWLVVGSIVVATVFLANFAWDQYNREPIDEITDEEIALAFEEAQADVQLGRIAAMEELSRAQLDVPSRRFTMDDAERADRLFLIGYEHCKFRRFGTCEAIMKRVASLKQDNAGVAFRLQAWASAARSGNTGKFPEVPNVRSLSEFEAAEMSKQLGVPAPPRPKEPAPAPAADADSDAGADAGAPDAGEGP
jgi:hypothetical protein